MSRVLTALFALTATIVAPACGGAADDATPTTAAATSIASTTATTAVSPTTIETSATTQAAPPTTTAAAAGGTLGATLLGEMDTVEQTSGRFEAIFSLTPAPESDLEGPIEIRFAGANAANGDAEFTMDLGSFFLATGETEDVPEEYLEAFAQPMEIKTIGNLSYSRGGFFAALLGSDKWFEGEASDVEDVAGDSPSPFTDDPAEFLSTLEDANADITVVGTEEINGVLTTHYRAVLDIAALADDLDDAERLELEESLGDVSVPDLPIDLWIGEDDGLVYRFVMELSAEALGEDSEDFVAMRMEFNLWDYGADIVIEPPPTVDIATDEDISFFGDA